MKHAVRARAKDAEVVLLRLASLVPLHVARTAALRAFGCQLGDGVVVYHGFEVRAARHVSIGDRTIVGDHATLDGRGGLTIGADVNLSTGVSIWTGQHDWRAEDFRYVKAPVAVGDRAWLSTRVIVLPGSTIGEGAVVAAGAVVSGDIPPFVLAAGVPARPVKERPKGLTYRLGGGKAWWW